MFFADKEVHTVGQIIGVVLADTKVRAQAGARAVRIQYEELPYILTIGEAIEQESFFKPRSVLRQGYCERSWEEEEQDDNQVVLEGSTLIGGQEQVSLYSPDE